MSSRKTNSIKNITYSISSYFLITVMQFVNRTIFIHILSSSYLGLNGLFSNILSFLSLAELGLGTAMNYALYRPLKEQDSEKIKSIMLLYKKCYRVIGIIVLVLGSALTPFLTFLIKDMPSDMPNIRVYYLLYVLNSGISYFYTYKRSIIVCDQKEYISSITTTIARLATSVLQIILLLVTKSFILYLAIAVVVTFLENVCISAIADKRYPYLKEKNINRLSRSELKEIRKNVFAMMFHKIGTVIVFATDNIIISKFVGLVAVGIYSNYTLIINSVNSVLARVFSAITASVGELAISEDTEHTEQVFSRILFANIWMYGFCSICFVCLLQPFIRLWLGSEFVMSMITLLFAAVSFYITGVRKTVNTFKDASGIFWNDRYKPVIESVCNIVFSIPLAIRFGVSGVLAGTILSSLIVPFWFEPYVLYKNLFNKSCRWYLIRQALYFAVVAVIGAVTWLLCSLIPWTGIAGFLILLVICGIVPNALFTALTHRTDSFRYYKGLVLSVRNKK